MSQMKNLSGKVAIVTGASRGIGRAIALKLGEQGAHCILTARNETNLQAVRREIGDAHAIALDLRLPKAPAQLVDFALGQAMRLDIVVNNAGATKRGAFTALTDDDWADGFALKFFGAVRLCRAAWLHLKATQGSILNISGTGGRTPGAEFSIGGSVNAALLSLTKSLADAGIIDGIQVNCVNPGAVRTDRLKKRLNDLGIDLPEAERKLIATEKITRIGEPEDIAELVAFIVSPQGRFLHGSLIDIDGGATKTI